MKDTLKHQGRRRKLVEIIHEKGITREAVLRAIGKVPRHLFLDSGFDDYAYIDKAFPIGEGQTISQPYTVAFQTELLEVKPGMKILEIGTGSGYQAAVLLEMGAKVYTVERQKELFKTAKATLTRLGYRPVMSFGDGYKGLPAYAPYDGIVVTCGAPFIPRALAEQLKPGGRMVIPVGVENQKMMLVKRDKEGKLYKKEYGAFRFVPMVGDKES